jgi:hypothetical protein
MEISQLKNKIASRGHWYFILGPVENNKTINNSHPRDNYEILRKQGVHFRGRPFPYFPKIDSLHPERENVSLDENITAYRDWEHYKECFTLFNSGQFFYLTGLYEDWVDESTRLQETIYREYSPGTVLNYVTATYFLTEVFIFVKNMIDSELYKEADEFLFDFRIQKTKGRTLKIFDPKRVGFFQDYKCTAPNITLYKSFFVKKYFIENWKEELLKASLDFYKFFGNYEPNEKVIKSDIDNLLNRRF